MTAPASPFPADAGTMAIEPLAPSADAGMDALPLAGGRLFFSRMRVFFEAPDGARRILEIACTDTGRFAASLPAPAAEAFRARLAALTAPRPPMALAGSDRPLSFARPLVMGIVNVTPDSFSDGGRHATPEAAIAHGRALIAAGADLLDIGGESTRPGAAPVWEEEEKRRVLPVVEALAAEGALLSIDSRNAGTMASALAAGARIVNDVSALRHDPESAAVLRESRAPLILMHARGDPGTMQDDPRYDNVVLEVFSFLESRIDHAVAAGIGRDRLIVDPGIGFGKTVRHNLDLLNALGSFHGLGVPLLLGVSRKRFIGALSRGEAPDDRLGGSLAAAIGGLAAGAHILRVHDVAETVQAIRVREGLIDAATIRRMELAADGMSDGERDT